MADTEDPATQHGGWAFDGTSAGVAQAVKDGKVIHLKTNADLDKFYELIDEPAGVDDIPADGALIMAYASWCGHCKTAKPEMAKAAAALKKFPFARIDADEASTDSVAGFEVSGYPTLVVIRDSSPDKEDMKFKSALYHESRTEASFTGYVNSVFYSTPGSGSADGSADGSAGTPADAPTDTLTKEDAIAAVNAGQVIELTTDAEVDDFMSFRDELPGNGGVILGVKSDCKPCASLRPHFDKAAAALAGKAAFATVNLPYVFGDGKTVTDDAGKTLCDVPITGYPTTVMFKDGTGADGSAFEEKETGAGKALSLANAVNDFLGAGLDPAALEAALKDFVPDTGAASSTTTSTTATTDTTTTTTGTSGSGSSSTAPAAELDAETQEAAEEVAAGGCEESEYVEDLVGLELAAPEDAAFYAEEC